MLSRLKKSILDFKLHSCGLRFATQRYGAQKGLLNTTPGALVVRAQAWLQVKCIGLCWLRANEITNLGAHWATGGLRAGCHQAAADAGTDGTAGGQRPIWPGERGHSYARHEASRGFQGLLPPSATVIRQQTLRSRHLSSITMRPRHVHPWQSAPLPVRLQPAAGTVYIQLRAIWFDQDGRVAVRPTVAHVSSPDHTSRFRLPLERAGLQRHLEGSVLLGSAPPPKRCSGALRTLF